MGFFRNREVRRDIWILGGLTISAALCGFLYAFPCGIMLLAFGIVLTTVHLIITHRRYQKIAALSGDIDSLLHGNRDIRFESYTEGELSVLENELQKMTLRLRETAEALGKEKVFLQNSIADISHQLRTPLTSINLVLSMLSAEDLDEERRRELCRELRSLIGRIDWLVETLLKMSKIDAGSVQFRREKMPVSRLIQKAAQPLEIALEIRQQQIVTHTEDVICTADSCWTAEAIGNILKNCMEHTPNGGKLTITAQETPIYTEIRIADTGRGIEAKDLPHLFERFYKGGNAPESSFGIGLALCHSIITAQGGMVKAENTGTGAAFTIRFPKQMI